MSSPFRLAVTAIGLSALAVAALSPSVAHAQGVPGFVVTGPDKQVANGAPTFDPVGYTFTYSGTAPALITELGVFNNDAGSLSSTKGVSLWTTGGVELASATISNVPNTDPVDNQGNNYTGTASYTYSTLLTPVVVTPNETLYIEADNESYTGGATATGAPNITYGDSWFGNGNSADNNAITTYSGPGASGSFQNDGYNALTSANFIISAAPEPSEFGIIALCSLGLGAMLLRARSRANGIAAG